jgi:hypothetical protein
MTKPRRLAPSDTANNAFIKHCFRIDEALKVITEARANHFGVDANAQRNWGEVGDAEYIADQLTALADRLLKRGEYAED